jgi:hypothetical protein
VNSLLLCRCAGRSRSLRAPIGTLILLLFALLAGAKTTTSITNGLWFQTNTWNNGIPGPSDTVNLTNAVSLSTNVPVNVGLLNIGGSNGFLVLATQLNLNGQDSIWSNGAFYSGPVVVVGSLLIDGPAGVTNPIEIGVLTNLGLITHEGVASVGMPNGIFLINAVGANYDFQSGVGITNLGINVAPGPYFENDGLLSKSVAGGESVVGVDFNNRGGTIDVQVGTITLSNAYTQCTNGTFNVSNGAVLNLTDLGGNGGNDTFSGVFTGSGTGQVQLNFHYGVGSLTAIPPCSFNFPTNLFQWNSSIIGGTLTNLGSITLASTNTKELSETLVNFGQVEERSTGIFYDAGSFLNMSGGLFEFQSDTGISNAGGLGSFSNSGLLRKASGSGNSIVGAAFSNVGGTIDVLSGQITLAGGGSSTNGTFNVSAGSVLDLTGGFVGTAYYGTFAGSGAGQVQLNNGGLELFPPNSCTFNFPTNLFQWNGGSIYLDTVTLTNLGSLTLAGTNTKELLGTGLLVNFGQIEESGAGVFDDAPPLLNMSGGLFEFQSDAGISNLGGSITNNGLVRKISGSGASTVAVPFSNTGTVQALSGTLSFSSSFTQTAGTTSLDGGALASSLFSGFNIQGGSLIGSGLITGNVTSGGSVSPGLSAGTVGAIQITGNYTQTTGGALNIALAGRSAGQFDQLNVNGSTTLNGAFNVSLLPGFAPVAGDSYQIISNSSHSGTFSVTNGLPVGMLVDYRTNGVFLDVTTNIPPTLIQPALVGTNFSFAFQSVSNATYTVQVNTNLATTNWTSLQIISGNGSLQTVTEPFSNTPQQFFRISRP